MGAVLRITSPGDYRDDRGKDITNSQARQHPVDAEGLDPWPREHLPNPPDQDEQRCPSDYPPPCVCVDSPRKCQSEGLRLCTSPRDGEAGWRHAREGADPKTPWVTARGPRLPALKDIVRLPPDFLHKVGRSAMLAGFLRAGARSSKNRFNECVPASPRRSRVDIPFPTKSPVPASGVASERDLKIL